MGNNWSFPEEAPPADPWWPSAQLQPGTSQSARSEEIAEVPCRGRVREEELETFKQELAQKRALRQEALAVKQKELSELRSRLEEEKCLRQKAEEERDKLKTMAIEELQKELQKEKEEKVKLLDERKCLLEEIEEKAGLERQVQALKDVSQIGKEMLRIRELQVKELKKKLVEINISSVVAPPEDLRLEYEKQIENIRKLRTLYEERAAATLIEHRREMEREEAKIVVLETKLSDMQTEIEDFNDIKKDLETKIESLENVIQQHENELEKAKDDLFSSNVQNSSLNSQMTLINNLFSNMLVRPEVDLDRLTRLLHEHHGLITDLTVTGDSNDVAPLLVDLAVQIDKEKESDQKEEIREEANHDINTQLQSEIASNLTKVWRVMIELLSHHQEQTQMEPAGGVDSCYKNIETPSGTRSVISVSQTFLTLKDLILEKNKLVKEVGRLKTLNNHLENRLGSQEKRLSVVTTELRKTWAVVNKLKAQHKQLHTHEKILRYELQQKRCMLTELKEELEHCKEKWEQARQKNSQTEEDWKELRKEFAARKSRKESNSAESGFEEDDIQSPPSESNKYGNSLFELPSKGVSEPELSEEDIEHSDGNSFDTVIDLLDIACLENQHANQLEVPYVLCDVSPQALDINPNLLPLTGSEFTEGLDQIESEDLAAVLDVQYQTQLLGANYNLSLPSSSGSSPIPTENDEFTTSSEVDISEEDLSSNDNHIYSSPLPNANQSVSEDVLLFGSNSSKNISRFLDGLFVDEEQNSKKSAQSNVTLNIPSTSKTDEEFKSVNATMNKDGDCDLSDDLTPKVSEESLDIFSENYAKEEIVINHDNEKDLEKVPTSSNSQLRPIDKYDVIEIPLELKNEQVPDPMSSHTQQQRPLDKSDIIEIPIVLKNEQVEVPISSQAQQLLIDKHGINDQVTKTVYEPETRTPEEMLKAREARLKRLEHQCRSLVNKVTSTSFRSEIISNKLDELHLAYGPVEHDLNGEPDLKEETKIKCINKTQQQDTNNITEASSSKTFLSLKNAKSEEKQGDNLQCKHVVNMSNFNETSDPNIRTSSNEVIDQRNEKLKRLEDQCKSLFSKMTATSSKIESTTNNSDGNNNTSVRSIDSSVQPVESSIFIPSSNKMTSENNTKVCEVNKEVNLKTNDHEPTHLSFQTSEILDKSSIPGPSVEPEERVTGNTKKGRTPEEILEARAERFKRLEDQCKSLLSKMTATSLRSEIISNKLDELHSCYGSSEDTSDNEEHSSLSKNTDKKSLSSARYNKKYSENDKKKQHSSFQDTNDISSTNTDLAKLVSEEINVETRNCIEYENDAALLRRISEEALPTQGQSSDNAEKKCDQFLSKLSPPSNETELLNNSSRQHCMASTSDETLSLHKSPEVNRVQQNGDDGRDSLTNTVKEHADSQKEHSSNNSKSQDD